MFIVFHPAWKEVKVAVVSKRQEGESVLPEDWDKRELPKPTMSIATAAIEPKPEFQKRFETLSKQLNVHHSVTVLGDGAKWIWNMVEEMFVSPTECLDIFHAAEKISELSKVLFKKKEHNDWFASMRMIMLNEGYCGVDVRLKALQKDKERFTSKQRKAILVLRKYFWGNRERMNYRERLLMGKAIGSGQVEGACKSLVGRRLKQTGACWRVGRLNRIAVLCSAVYSCQWKYL